MASIFVKSVSVILAATMAGSLGIPAVADRGVVEQVDSLVATAESNPAVADQVKTWFDDLESVAKARGVSDAVTAGNFVEAVRAASGTKALPTLPYALGQAPSLSGLESLPVDIRQSVELLVATVVEAQALNADGEHTTEASLLILQAVKPLLATLTGRAPPLSRAAGLGAAALDPMPLEHAAEMIVEARKSGQPFSADINRLREFEAWLKSQTEPPTAEQLSGEFHAGITDPMPHAVKHAAHEIEMFLENFEMAREPPPAASGGGLTGQFGCIVILGLVRICDTDPQFNAVPIPIHIDLGGSDTYTYGAGAAAGVGGVQVVVDLGGSDLYAADDLGQGAGVDGAVGILVDASGDDFYATVGTSPALGQGYGRTGAGVLVDLSGNDFYALLDFHATSSPPGPDVSTAFSPDVETRGQGAGDATGLGVLLDAGGSDFYFASALTLAEVSFGPFAPRPDFSHVLHIARSGTATAHVQGAAEGQSVGVHVDVDTPAVPVLPPGFGFNGFFTFAGTFATANEFSNINFGGSRTCIAESDDARVRAHGAATGGSVAIGVRASTPGLEQEFGGSSGFANAVSFAFGECFEISSTQFNAHLQSYSHSGDSTAEAQGAGVDGGVGVLLQVSVPSVGAAGPVLPFTFNGVFADTISVACSEAFQFDGHTNANAIAGRSNTWGQGAGQGGEGVLLSVGSNDFYLAGAFETANAWTLAIFGGTGLATADFDGSPDVFGPALPSVRVQGYASGGVGALGDLLGSDSYVTGFPGFSFASRFQTIIDPLTFVSLSVNGLDVDKADVDGAAGVAVFVDLLASPDFYGEFGAPASGAVDGGQVWGTVIIPPIPPPIASSGEFVEIGVDI